MERSILASGQVCTCVRNSGYSKVTIAARKGQILMYVVIIIFDASSLESASLDPRLLVYCQSTAGVLETLIIMP